MLIEIKRVNEQILLDLGYSDDVVNTLYDHFSEYEMSEIICYISNKATMYTIKQLITCYQLLKSYNPNLLNNVFPISEIQNEEIVNFLSSQVLSCKDVRKVAIEVTKHNITSLEKVKILCCLNEKEEIDISKISFLSLNQIIQSYLRNKDFVISILHRERKMNKVV